MPGGDRVTGSRWTAEVPEEVEDYESSTYKSGPRKGQPKHRPPTIVLPAYGLMVIKRDGEVVAFVAKKYAETVRAALEAMHG